MLGNLSSALFSVFSRPDLQKTANIRKTASTTTPKVKAEPNKFDNEVKALEEKFGTFPEGTFTIDLQELNKVVPRKRVRLDAYQGLQSHLLKTKGVELIIKSRKRK